MVSKPVVKRTVQEFPDSFGAARKNFKVNLKALLSQLDYTAATLALRLNTICESDTLATSDVYKWLEGTAIPNVYHLYKMATWLNIPMGQLFSNSFDASAVQGHSFARQQPAGIAFQFVDEVTHKPFASVSPSGVNIKNINETNTIEDTTLMTTNNTNVVAISKTNKKQMEETVKARTTSRTYNLLLANKIYSSEMQLKDIATKVGASTRSLRDYAFYNQSLPENVAANLVKLFKTSYHSLGLKLNKEDNRYYHLTIKVKA